MRTEGFHDGWKTTTFDVGDGFRVEAKTEAKGFVKECRIDENVGQHKLSATKISTVLLTPQPPTKQGRACCTHRIRRCSFHLCVVAVVGVMGVTAACR